MSQTGQMVGTYNGWLVILSVVVAVVASYVSLELLSHGAMLQGRRSAWYWVLGGAISIGGGIWSMHFIGMLAYRLPIAVSYDLRLTAVSLIVPILVAGIGLHQGVGGIQHPSRFVAGGLLVGMGIVGMHYVGMAAMKMQPPIRYDPTLVGLSILVPVVASTAGLWSSFRLRMETILSALWQKVGSAFLIGGGIVGMHYTGMAAATFAPDSVCTASLQEFDPFWLGATIASFSLASGATMLLISATHAYHASQAKEQSNRKLVEMQELERRQLSRELHDRVGQNLTALGINLEILKTQGGAEVRPESRSRLDDSIDLLEATAEAIDNVMAELRPPMLDDHGMLPALRWLARQFSQRTGIEVSVRGEEPAKRPRPEIEIALFRIAQEALTNVAKHARARHIDLLLNQSGGECSLAVIDDGVGMDSARLSEASTLGHGIVTMRERVQAVGGSFEMNSVANDGTHVKVRVPF
jgi:NO-binding membrane sensor protein with MHYT domain/two-component sensor histidine kinase